MRVMANRRMDRDAAQALSRLTLYTIARTHELFGKYQRWLIRQIEAAGDRDGIVDATKLDQSVILGRYSQTVREYTELLAGARRQAASIPFGKLRERHNFYFREVQITEAQYTKEDINNLNRLWEQRRAAALQAGEQRIVGDDIKILSDRIWNLEHDGLNQIRANLLLARQERTNTAKLARQVEYLLGADQDLPRWTYIRLYKMDPKQRLRSPAELLKSPLDRQKGLAYKAVRLARTELQYSHHAVDSMIARNTPWTEGRYTRLSAGHPKSDVCDEYADGGPYPVDEEILPLHPNCMCWYEHALMDGKKFRHLVRRYAQGENDFLADYVEWMGNREMLTLPKMKIADALELWNSNSRDAQAASIRMRTPNGRARAVKLPKPGPEAPTAIPAAADGFPESLAKLEKVKDLGGSTGATLVRDPDTGRLFVRKYGKNVGHLLDEAAADEAYQSLGVRVPRFRLYDEGDAKVKLAEYIEGQTLKELRKDPVAFQAALKKLQDDFVADAVLANWDVVGLDYDNILVDAAGNVWRIDNGGALKRRAQGQLKGNAFGRYVDELWTLRNKGKNERTWTAFGNMNYDDVLAQMESVAGQRQELLAALPDEYQTLMGQRLDHIQDMARVGRTLREDQWFAPYVDDFSRHITGIEKRGITDRFPRQLTHNGVNIYDENGVIFDELRGPNSRVQEFAQYLNDNGGDYNVISYWMEKQAVSSSSGASQATKYFYSTRRDVPLERYFWSNGLEKAQHHYTGAISSLGEQKYNESLTAWHAFNYEFLRTTDFPRNSLKQGVVKLMRTENLDVMQFHTMAVGDTKVMTRGAAESFSIWKQVVVKGREMTEQELPHQRVFGTYFFERKPGSRVSPFFGDNENEFVGMAEGVEAKYTRRVAY